MLLIGAAPQEIASAHATQLSAPDSIADLRHALRGSEPDLFDSALISQWESEMALVELAQLVRRSVRPGGVVAFVAPITQMGWRGARGAVLGLIRRQRPIPLEGLCGALLLARLIDIRARSLEGATGHAVVWGTVPPAWREDIESSAVLPSMKSVLEDR